MLTESTEFYLSRRCPVLPLLHAFHRCSLPASVDSPRERRGISNGMLDSATRTLFFVGTAPSPGSIEAARFTAMMEKRTAFVRDDR